MVITHPTANPPSYNASLVAPPATFVPLPICTFTGQADCLTPCPRAATAWSSFRRAAIRRERRRAATAARSSARWRTATTASSAAPTPATRSSAATMSSPAAASSRADGDVLAGAADEHRSADEYRRAGNADGDRHDHANARHRQDQTPTRRTHRRQRAPRRRRRRRRRPGPRRRPAPRPRRPRRWAPGGDPRRRRAPGAAGADQHPARADPRRQAGAREGGERRRPAGPRPGALVRLVASDGDCPAGTSSGAPDFDKHTAGNQDTVFLSGGRQATASVNIGAVSTAVHGVQPSRSASLPRPAHGRQSMISGNVDPAPLEQRLPARDQRHRRQRPGAEPVHETFLPSVRAAVVKLGRGHALGLQDAAIGAGNGDLFDPRGTGRWSPPATATVPPARSAPPTSTAWHPATRAPSRCPRARQERKADARTAAASFTSRNLRSPARCIAFVTGTGPAGDTDASNNVAWLVVDVVDRNDF